MQTAPQVLNVHLSDLEKRRLRTVAAKSQMTMSQVARIALARLLNQLQEDNICLTASGELQQLTDDAGATYPDGKE